MTADVVIIGAGITGLSIAYELTKRGVNNILIIDRFYPGYGATNRCGAGVRAQWGLKLNCIMTKRSIERFTTLSEELGYDIEFRQGGYLILVHNEKQLAQFRKNIELQNSLGIPSRLIDINEAKSIVPFLDTSTIIAATFCPIDGHCNPMKTVWAYVWALKQRGVRIEKFTEVTEIIIENNEVKGVITNNGKIFSPVVVNAAGGWSQVVARLAGIDIPVFSERHQILVTEPVQHLFDCMVISFKTGIYIQQVPHGSIIGGIAEKEEPSFNMESTWQFVAHFVSEATKILPVLKDIHIVRQWAGLYNKTPDAQPIICESEIVKGFYLACGFSGHGFMVSPVTGEIVASLITKTEPPFDVSWLSLERFKRGELIVEPSVVG